MGPIPYDNFRYENAADGGAGSWTATAADLCRLMTALDGLPNYPDILDPARVNELEMVALPAVHPTQAHGWDSSTVNPPARVSKGGAIGFGAALLTRSKGPARLTVAVVCNSSVGATALATNVYNAVEAVQTIDNSYDLFPARPDVPEF